MNIINLDTITRKEIEFILANAPYMSRRGMAAQLGWNVPTLNRVIDNMEAVGFTVPRHKRTLRIHIKEIKAQMDADKN